MEKNESKGLKNIVLIDTEAVIHLLYDEKKIEITLSDRGSLRLLMLGYAMDSTTGQLKKIGDDYNPQDTIEAAKYLRKTNEII